MSNSPVDAILEAARNPAYTHMHVVFANRVHVVDLALQNMPDDAIEASIGYILCCDKPGNTTPAFFDATYLGIPCQGVLHATPEVAAAVMRLIHADIVAHPERYEKIPG